VKLVPLFSVCLVFTAACAPQRPPPRSAPPAPSVPVTSPSVLPGPTELGTFWEPWFASPYEYMFTSPAGAGWEESPPAAARAGHVFGGGIRGFYFYGGFEDCLRAWMGQEQIYGDDEYASLSALAGRPFKIGQVGEGWDRGFGRYDPAVIDWALATFVPSPEQPIASKTFGAVYDETFFRAVRLHALAYARLQTKYDLDAEAKAYLAAMTNEPDFYGVQWLEDRYGGDLRDAYPLGWDGTMMTGSMVMGFWLRRHVDGSAPSLTRALGVVLRVYDPGFVQRHASDMRWFGGAAGGVQRTP